MRRRLWGGAIAVLVGLLAGGALADGHCAQDRTLRFGFYGYFDPLSYAANGDPTHSDFNTHLGYEADLVTALERLDDAGLRFSRHGIVPWPGIWLRSVSEFDVVGGGITILETRTRNDGGETVVRFTDGHVAFRQSLLVRAADEGRYPTHAALTSAVRVGVLAGTTGEARLLQLTGLVDGDGNLVAGTRVTTAAGEVEADGSAAFRITASGSTANLEERQRLSPPDEGKPQVVYLGDVAGEQELLDALAAGDIDAVARGEIGNRDASAESGGRYAVTAIDRQAEYGGFTVNASRADLLMCLNERIAWLTAGGVVGYAQWRENPRVFAERAALWNELQRDLASGGAVRDLPALLSLATEADVSELVAAIAGERLTIESSAPELVYAQLDAAGNLALVVDEGAASGPDGESTATITLTWPRAGGVTVLAFDVVVAPTRAFFRGWRLLLPQLSDPARTQDA